jgi:Ca-activated chloride channel family protein
MSLQNIGALIWLPLLGGFIVLLYLLRMRRRDVKVPATFLWPERTEEIRANALFQRLRFSWLLVLQLLALALVVMALARPQTKQRGLTGEVTVIVVDASASMGASDVKPTRFDEAKRLAKEAVQSEKAGDRVALIEAGPNPRVVFSLSNDPAKQVRAIDQMQRSDSEVDIGDALRLASALVGTEESARIVLLSDGDFEPVKDFSRGKSSFVYKSIGDNDHNLAISALGIADTGQGRQVYASVKNPSGAQLSGKLNLFADRKLIDSDRFTIATDKSYGKTVMAPAGAKVVEAKLESDDLLKSDNYAVALANPGASLRVLLVGKGDYFLERALSLDPRVTLDRADEVPATERGSVGGGSYDIVVFDGTVPVPVRARGVLELGTAGPGSPVNVQGSQKNPNFLSAERSKLLEGVDFQNVYIDSAQTVRPTSEGKVLASTTKGPLVVASEGDQKHVYLAFSPLQSDFPLNVGFPIFIANALDFLGGESNSGDILVKAGQSFQVASAHSVELTHPDGSKESIPSNGASAIIRSANQVGAYRITVEGKVRNVYATLRSDRESKIMPEVDVMLGGGSVKAVESPLRFADFWRPLILLCLLVLAGEWWLFARKS